MQIHCCTFILNVTATQYTCSLKGVYRPHWWVQRSHPCSQMRVPVHSPWLPLYINVSQPSFFTVPMAGLFLDRPCYIWIQFCVKSEHLFAETLQMIQEAAAMGNWGWAASSLTMHHQPMHHVSCRVFWWNIKSPRGLSPSTAQIWHPATSVFSQKITFEREEISDCWWDSGKYDGAADGDWENCVRSQGAYFEGDWGIIVLYIMCLVSCTFFHKYLYFL